MTGRSPAPLRTGEAVTLVSMVVTVHPDPAAELLVGFLNTAHIPDQEWLTGDSGSEWLASVPAPAGMPPMRGRGRRPDEAALERLHALREAVRARTRRRTADGPTPAAAVADVPLTLRLGGNADEPASLVPAEDSAEARAVAALAQALITAAATGSFSRVKTCANPDCQWAFFDESRNASRRWCLIDGCGNRAKNRTYRARLAASS